MRQIFILLAFLYPLYAFADAAPLTGTITYESRMISADGVEKSTRLTERLVRTSTHLWTERVIPASVAAERSATEEGHGHQGDEHLHPSDLARAAKHLSRDAKGQPRLSFILREERTVISAEPRDFEQLGFDGQWAASWSLFDPAQLKQLQKIDRKTLEGASWYEKREHGRFMRVLWSEPLRLALEVESGTDSGSRWSRTRLKLDSKPAAQLPWNQLAGYQQKDYVDLLD